MAAEPEEERAVWGGKHYHVLVVLFLCYACGMYAKGTMSLGIFGMGQDAKLGFSTEDISSLLAMGSAGCESPPRPESCPPRLAREVALHPRANSGRRAADSAGKLVGGPVSDALGAKGTLAIMLAIMGSCKMVIMRGSGLRVMTMAWAATRLAHALTWPGVMLGMRPFFLNNGSGTALSILTASSRVGATLGSILGGALLARPAGWRGVASTTGVVTLAVAALQLTLPSPAAAGSKPREEDPAPTGKAQPTTSKAAPAAGLESRLDGKKPPTSPTDKSPFRTKSMGTGLGDLGDRDGKDAEPAEEPAAVGTSIKTSSGPPKLGAGETVSIIVKSPKLWAVYASTAFVMPTFDLTTLLPLWLDSLGMDPVTIGSLGSLFPMAAVPVIFIAAQAHQRLSPKQRQLLYAPLLVMSAGALLLMSRLRKASAIIAPTLAVIMCGVAPTLYVPNYDFVLRFGGPLTGSLTALCDLGGNVLTTWVYSVYPKWLAVGGWELVFRWYAAMNLAAAVCIGKAALISFGRLDAWEHL